jgi:hypothetical protein
MTGLDRGWHTRTEIRLAMMSGEVKDNFYTDARTELGKSVRNCKLHRTANEMGAFF